MHWEVGKQLWSRESSAEVAVNFPETGVEVLGRCSHPSVELHLLLEARERLKNSWIWDPLVLLHHPRGSGHSREVWDWHIHGGRNSLLELQKLPAALLSQD